MRIAGTGQEDEILASLAVLVVTADELRRKLSVLLDTAPMDKLRSTSGLSHHELMPLNKRLQVIELISEAYKSVTEAASRFRLAEVKPLYDAGMSMDEIGAVIGVTRQRVSTLLRQASHQNLNANQHALSRSPGKSSGTRAATDPREASDMGRDGQRS